MTGFGAWLNQLDKNHPGQFTLFDKADNDIRDILVDHNDILWLATRFSGLLKIQSTPNAFQTYSYSGQATQQQPQQQRQALSTPIGRVNTFTQDSQGNIWLGTNGGALSHFDPNQDLSQTDDKPRFINYHNDKNQPTSIDGVVVNTLHQTNQHTLWVGLQQSLDKLTLSSGEFEHFSDEKGINSHNIKSIIEDELGYLWLATSKGISRYDVKQRLFVNFTNKDGFDGVPTDDENREVTVNVQLAETKITVTVGDNGKGIASNQLGKIFDPFYTTKRTSVAAD
jgi:ligand-binding sensor domain-containing protein